MALRKPPRKPTGAVARRGGRAARVAVKPATAAELGTAKRGDDGMPLPTNATALRGHHVWRALRARDAHPEPYFYYAVTTTGIVCRPGCPARLPLARNVRVFAHLPQALARGYRPCLRCVPQQQAPDRERAATRALVVAACQHLAHAAEPVTLAALARATARTPAQLRAAFASVLGVSPPQYQRSLRRARLPGALQAEASVAAAALHAGYGSLSRFYVHAGADLAMPIPAARQGGALQALQYATLPCALGTALVAVTPRGVAAVLLGDTKAEVYAELQARFPHAQLSPWEPMADIPVPVWLSIVERVLNASGAARQALGSDLAALPLDVAGTALQQRVWAALQRVPWGETRTYSDLAVAAGAPRAIRAVAAACAANPVAVVVPCHRIVRKDGALAGYRWGLARKRALLERERG